MFCPLSTSHSFPHPFPHPFPHLPKLYSIHTDGRIRKSGTGRATVRAAAGPNGDNKSERKFNSEKAERADPPMYGSGSSQSFSSVYERELSLSVYDHGKVQDTTQAVSLLSQMALFKHQHDLLKKYQKYAEGIQETNQEHPLQMSGTLPPITQFKTGQLSFEQTKRLKQRTMITALKNKKMKKSSNVNSALRGLALSLDDSLVDDSLVIGDKVDDNNSLVPNTVTLNTVTANTVTETATDTLASDANTPQLTELTDDYRSPSSSPSELVQIMEQRQSDEPVTSAVTAPSVTIMSLKEGSTSGSSLISLKPAPYPPSFILSSGLAGALGIATYYKKSERAEAIVDITVDLNLPENWNDLSTEQQDTVRRDIKSRNSLRSVNRTISLYKGAQYPYLHPLPLSERCTGMHSHTPFLPFSSPSTSV